MSYAAPQSAAAPAPAGPPPGGPGPHVAALDETCRSARTRPPGVDAARWSVLATAVLRAENVSAGELGLVFVEPDEMARLNREHMGRDGPTDVLAFPLDGPQGPAGAGAADIAGAGPLLGDVVVCPAVAAEHAPRHGGEGHDGSLEDELALLVVHGVLHVLGYDHDDDADAAVMGARERELLAAHRLAP